MMETATVGLGNFWARPLVKLVAVAFAVCVVICLVLYLSGMFSAWQDARKWQKEVAAQRTIAEQEKAKRIAAENEAAGWQGVTRDYKSQAEYQKGVSHELRNQMQHAVQELGERRAATINSSRAYEAVRGRPSVVRPDDTADAIGGRLRAGAEEFRHSNN